MSWWALPIVAGLGVVGFLAGWIVGTFLVEFSRNDPYDLWPDDEDW